MFVKIQKKIKFMRSKTKKIYELELEYKKKRKFNKFKIQ